MTIQDQPAYQIQVICTLLVRNVIFLAGEALLVSYKAVPSEFIKHDSRLFE